MTERDSIETEMNLDAEMAVNNHSSGGPLVKVSSCGTLASEHGFSEVSDYLSSGHLSENIPAFYKDASIFITGATGFLGKSILEKLLRSCPDVDRIFVLVRSKKGHNPNERVEALFNSKLFDRAQSERGEEECRRKVVAIAGDVMEPNLGISAEDEQLLVESNVTTVIHSAATIRFDEPLRFALSLNVGGTLRVVQLCRKLPCLKALVHVSTAYANCDLPFIEEQVYPPPVDPHKLLDALDWMTDEAASKITPVLIGGKPNTYTYTKHLAENLLMEEAQKGGFGGRPLPYIIVRPSIVGASWREPFPGWIDNFNGPSGLFIACGMGLLRSMIGKPDAIADIVPVDIVSNVILAAPWYRACVLSSCSSGNVKALTVTSSNTNNSNNSSASVSPLLGSHISDSSNSYSSSIQSPASSSHTNKKCPLSPPSSRASRSPPSTDHDHELTSDTSEVEISTGGSSRVVTRQHSSESSDEVSNSSDDCGIVTPDIGRKSSDSRHQQQFIVNCCSGYIDRPVKWGPLPTMVANSYLKNPIQTAVRYPNCNMTNNKMMYFLWVFTCHRVPAFLMDTYMRLIGKKPRMMSMYRKLHRSMDTLSFFTQRHWEWEVNSLRHMQHVIETLSTSSNKLGEGTTASEEGVKWGKEWNTSVKNIDWAEYLENFCVGTKCFVLNEEMSELHLAKQRMSRLKTLHYLFNIFTAAIVWRVIMLKSEVAYKLWNMFVRVFFKWIEAMRLSRFVTL
ncbi:fatty acyl-CoA reductase 1-like isoform X1 [Symsagittifera roscoffensis]|uniref:fatty acyl-CoA reductase 1-like isoform X1 n=1 Tax=Symsagittifera roscoffensis TaxID=84072 RepID=UPI00307CA8C2